MIIRIKDLELTFSVEDLNVMGKSFRMWMLNRIREEVESEAVDTPAPGAAPITTNPLGTPTTVVKKQRKPQEKLIPLTEEQADALSRCHKARLARCLGVTPANVNYWRKHKRAPERALGVLRQEGWLS